MNMTAPPIKMHPTMTPIMTAATVPPLPAGGGGAGGIGAPATNLLTVAVVIDGVETTVS